MLILPNFRQYAQLLVLFLKPCIWGLELKEACLLFPKFENDFINLIGNSGTYDLFLTKISHNPCDKYVCKAFF